ncbi:MULTISPECIES: hypothetical protein [Nostocales]|nr:MULTISPECIES: hypothetical protein [Nostocales]
MLFRQAGNLASEVYTNRYCDRDQAIAPLTIQYHNDLRTKIGY